MSANDMNKRVKELRELRRMAEELSAEITSIEDEIKAEMTARSVDMLSGDDWRVTWKLVASSRFDSKALKTANPELYATFTRTSETRRFCVA